MTDQNNLTMFDAVPEILKALEIADKFCGSLTSDECPDAVHISIRNALSLLSKLRAPVAGDVRPPMLPRDALEALRDFKLTVIQDAPSQ